MKPVRTKTTEMVYRGPTEEIGDLWTHRVRPGEIESFWRPDAGELEILNAGGVVELSLYNEPIPPIGMRVVSAEHAQVIDVEHTFRVPRELEERRRAEEL